MAREKKGEGWTAAVGSNVDFEKVDFVDDGTTSFQLQDCWESDKSLEIDLQVVDASFVIGFLIA